MTMNQGMMQNSFKKVTDTFGDLDKVGFSDLLKKTVTIANMKLQEPIDEWDLAIIMSAFCDAKVGQQPERTDAYRESIMWMSVAALWKENKTNQMPRVIAGLEEAMSGVNFVEPRQ